MKQISVFIFVFIFLGCSMSKEKKESDKQEDIEAQRKLIKETVNFVSIWNFTTKDKKFIAENRQEQIEELQAYWNRGKVENLYINSSVTDEKDESTIVFFVKATSEDDARKILDGLIFKKKGIADYELFPVGKNWLGRAEQGLSAPDKLKPSFLVTWRSIATPEEISKYAWEQTNETNRLYEKGIVENAYLNINNNDPSVGGSVLFFINADYQLEAENILNETIFVKKNIAEYEMFPVGVYWMGKTQ